MKEKNMRCVAWAARVMMALVSGSIMPCVGADRTQRNHDVNVSAIYSVPVPQNVALSPDGTRVLLTQQHPSENGFILGKSTLWVIDLVKNRTWQIGTANEKGMIRAGSESISWPRAKWSRDGRSVFWIDSDGANDQLWRYSFDTAGTEQVTRGDKRLLDYVESPDGLSMALVRILEPVRNAKKLENAEAYFFSDYPEGWWAPSRSDPVTIELMDVRTGAQQTIAERLPGAIDLSWDSTGERLVYLPRFETWGGVAVGPAIYNRATGETLRGFEATSTVSRPTWSPDGRQLAWVEHILYSQAPRETREGIPWAGGLFSLVPVLKYGRLRDGRVTEGATLLDEDALVRAALPIRWGEDGVIRVALSRMARTGIYAVDPLSGKRKLITPSEFHVADYDISTDGARLVAILTNANTPPEVYVGDYQRGEYKYRQISHVSQSLPFKPGRVRSVSWRSADDRFDVSGWLLVPPDYDSSKRYPMIVDLHGGPSATVMDDFWRIQTQNIVPAVFAAQGYVVLLPNPRGDPGYSVEYTKALVGDLWTGDVEKDILPGVEAMIAEGVADPGRLAVSGLSAGGIRVAWAIAHSDRFKAASLNDAPINMLSYWGQSLPYNASWLDFYLEGSPLDKMQEYIARSPITYVNNINTPLLMRYAYFDAKLWSSPMTMQGRELQAALYLKNVPTEVQIEPLAAHGHRTIASLQLWVDANLAWFDHYLKGKPYQRPSACGGDPASGYRSHRTQACVLEAPDRPQ